MTVVNNIKTPKETDEQNQDWENPLNPEKAEDKRDIEQIVRQKNEADRRNSNINGTEEEVKKAIKK